MATSAVGATIRIQCHVDSSTGAVVMATRTTSSPNASATSAAKIAAAQEVSLVLEPTPAPTPLLPPPIPPPPPPPPTPPLPPPRFSCSVVQSDELLLHHRQFILVNDQQGTLVVPLCLLSRFSYHIT